jgi:hypothetical protein
VTTRKLLISLLLVLPLVAGASAAPAEAVKVGLGDHGSHHLGEDRYRALGLKRLRLVVPWNVALRSSDRRLLDDWLAGAKAYGVEPFVSLGAAGNSRCPKRPCVLPSVSSFDRAFRAFRKRWPWVKVIGVWNEANHRSQPTFKRPDRAAQFFNVVRKRCRGCTVVAADVIDDRNMVRWLADFKEVARGPRIWGLHNYRDANPRRGQRYGGTKELLSAVRGKVWLTETGGIVKFVLPDGRTLFPHSEKRANLAITRVFRLAKRYRSRIDRLYIYHWRQSDSRSRFDAGLVRASGEPRASYHTLRRWLATPWFAP